MRKVYLLIFFLTFINIFAQETYSNGSNAYYNKKGGFYNTEEATISDITMCRDNKFVMWMRPMISCFTWQSFTGIWNKKGNIYNLIESQEITENDYTISYEKTKDNFYLIKFSSDKNSNLKDLKINITYEYDIDSKIEDKDPKFFNLNEDKEIKIFFRNIPQHDKLASIRLNFNFKNRKIQAYLTQNFTVNVKKENLSNKIFFNIIEEPKKDIVKNTIIIEKKNEKFIIKSINKNKTKIPDYTVILKMEKEYLLNKGDNGAYNCD